MSARPPKPRDSGGVQNFTKTWKNALVARVFDMSKKSDDHKSRTYNNPLQQHRQRCCEEGTANASGRLSFPACVITYVVAFALSLQGGDLWFINSHLTIIGSQLLLAVLAFTAALWHTVLLPHTRRIRWAQRGLLLACFLAFLAYDHGEELGRHGFYNALIMLVIAVPLNLVLGALLAWYSCMSPRAFATSFVAFLVLFSAGVGVGLVYYQSEWERGFDGRRLQSSASSSSGRLAFGGGGGVVATRECSWPSNLPFMDLLPHGAQNFWTGSQTCVQRASFEADLSNTGLLSIRGCKSSNVSYTVFPDTRDWPTERKTTAALTFQSEVLSHLEPQPYSEPVRLQDAEAVLATCGSEERLLVRVAPRTDRAKPKMLSRSDDKAQGKLNVLILFFDAVSRRHFHRKMPLTEAALTKLQSRGISTLYEFFRYHAVGFHTGPNTRALYGGLINDTHLAETPIWSAFRSAGYATGFINNHCEDWGAEYMKHAPTGPIDHELIAPFCLTEYHPAEGDGHKTFQGAYSILRRCLRGKHVHRYNFEYMKSFMETYENRPWFFANTFIEGHEGTGEVLRTVDADLASFFTDLSDEELRNTAIFLLADHGLHMGLNYVYLTNGRVEHVNPLLTVMLPNELLAGNPELALQMQANTQKLVTAFDIFTTFNHLLHFRPGGGGGGEVTPQELAAWAKAGNFTADRLNWGRSLFGPVPEGRTCADADVSQEYCKCAPTDRRR